MRTGMVFQTRTVVRVCDTGVRTINRWMMDRVKVKVIVVRHFGILNLADNFAGFSMMQLNPELRLQLLCLYEQRQNFVLFEASLLCALV